jgi:hypothetical protein
MSPNVKRYNAEQARKIWKENPEPAEESRDHPQRQRGGTGSCYFMPMPDAEVEENINQNEVDDLHEERIEESIEDKADQPSTEESLAEE